MRKPSLIFWPVKIRTDRKHSWKDHCRSSLMRELLGYIDLLAANHEHRFVYASISDLTEHCWKGPKKEGKHFHQRPLKAALAEAREQHIISNYFETHDGNFGFIVAPHDTLCRSDGKTCLLPNRSAWTFKNEQPDWRSKVLTAVQQHSKQHRESTQNSTAGAPKTAPKTAPTDSIDSTQNSTQNSTDPSVQQVDWQNLTDADIAAWFANGMTFGASNRVSLGSLLAEKPKEPLYPSAQDEIEHHHKFLAKHAEKQQQKQPQEQRQVSEAVSFSGEPKTAEAKATPKATQPGRKRDVKSQDEYERDRIQRDAQYLTPLGVTKSKPDAVYETDHELCSDGIRRVASERQRLGFTVKDENLEMQWGAQTIKGVWTRSADWKPPK